MRRKVTRRIVLIPCARHAALASSSRVNQTQGSSLGGRFALPDRPVRFPELRPVAFGLPKVDIGHSPDLSGRRVTTSAAPLTPDSTRRNVTAVHSCTLAGPPGMAIPDDPYHHPPVTGASDG